MTTQKKTKQNQKWCMAVDLWRGWESFAMRTFLFRGKAHKNPNLIPQTFAHCLLYTVRSENSDKSLPLDENYPVCPYQWRTRAGSKCCDDLSSLISSIWQNWLRKPGTWVCLSPNPGSWSNYPVRMKALSRLLSRKVNNGWAVWIMNTFRSSCPRRLWAVLFVCLFVFLYSSGLHL